MTLTELRYVLAVARERHFGRAAESCFVSQPTLSVGVKKLEEELGIELFERAKNEIAITPLGERFVEQAQRVMEGVDELKAIAQFGKDPLVGPLKIGVIYTIGPYLLPSLIPQIHQLAPGMPLIIEENFTAVLSEKLKHGELDAIIISRPFNLPGTESVDLYDEPFVVVLPANHPWEKQQHINPANLAGENLLLLGSGHCFRDQVIAACPECIRSSSDESMQKTFEGSSLETIKYMVASGVGITVFPVTSISNEQQNRLLRFRPFDEPVPERRVSLVWRNSFTRLKALECLQQAVTNSALESVQYIPPNSDSAD